MLTNPGLVRFCTAIMLIFCLSVKTTNAAPHAVTTFESIGIYWGDAKDAGKNNECQLEYRVVGAGAWKSGLALWFDNRGGNHGPVEYRGSLVSLSPDTEYEIRLTLQSGTKETFLARTWSEAFPIVKTIELPEHSANTLVITESGSANGYILYTHPVGKTSTINSNNANDYNITIDASHIVIRGLRLQGARKHAIRLYTGAKDVVIEDSDISGWGRIHKDGWGENMDSAIYSNSAEVERLVVQRTKLHHPRADSNNWLEYRAGIDAYHPEGPQSISLLNTSGNHVIRYNEIYSDEDHYFNDCLGGGSNFSYAGSANRDTDIYGNYISHCWDDGIEAEGANRNVRIWENYIDNSFVAIATSGTSIGPLYIWRNIYAVSQKSDLKDWNSAERGGFLKTKDKVNFTGGKIFLFHNTILQPTIIGAVEPIGAATALGWGGNLNNVMSRNNILQVHNSNKPSIDGKAGVNGDYDYDLFNGRISGGGSLETNGINGVPVYDPPPSVSGIFQFGKGVFTLSQSSPGYDSGVELANFNDEYKGDGPDIGAHEAGTPLMKFGTNAR